MSTFHSKLASAKPARLNESFVGFLEQPKKRDSGLESHIPIRRQQTANDRTGRASNRNDSSDQIAAKTQGANAQQQQQERTEPQWASSTFVQPPPQAAATDYYQHGELGDIPTRDRTYADKKRVGANLSSAERLDRVMKTERENNALQEKENFLTQEIITMETKLRRVEELCRKRARAQDDAPDYDITDMQRDLKYECDDLRGQNDAIREKVRKLNVVQKGLTKQMNEGPLHKSGIAKNEKYAHVQGKLEITHSKVSKRYQEETKTVDAQIKLNHTKARQLGQELAEAVATNGPAGEDERLQQETLEMQRQHREIELEMERMHADFLQNEANQKEAKVDTGKLKEKIRVVLEDNRRLREINMKLENQKFSGAHLKQDLEQVSRDRQELEKAVHKLAQEPFLKKGEEEGNSVGVRIAAMQSRLDEKAVQARAMKEGENRVVAEFNERENDLGKLQAETNKVEGTHKAVLIQYKNKLEKNTKVQAELNATGVNGLHKMDATNTSLQFGLDVTGSAPQWANINFITQQVTTKAAEADDNYQLKEMRVEIERIRAEKAEFVAELVKAKDLLNLQRDIQKENDSYYSHEEKRITVIATSISQKAEDLQRRADEKTKAVAQFQKTMAGGLTRQSGNNSLMRASVQTNNNNNTGTAIDDAQSDFTAQTEESEVAIDDNILDFKVEEAEFFPEAIAAVRSLKMSLQDVERHFISLVTVDFYNHATETTQLKAGLTDVNYQTQFSFINKVDNFYVNFLQKNSIKMDLYASRMNEAIQVGRAEIPLKDLIASDAAAVRMSILTPSVSIDAEIFAVGQAQRQGMSGAVQQQKPLGKIKIKMKLRKPIQQALRHIREQQQISNIENFVATGVQNGAKGQKKVVTIQIIGAEDLQLRHSDTRKIQPFFFYQFYTFDDHYSKSTTGTNPKFNDTRSFEVFFDEKAEQYFQRQSLDVILFDDLAPIAGVAYNQNQKSEHDDMIGMCKVPLDSLATGSTMQAKFPIGKIDAPHIITGQLEIRIEVMAIDGVQEGSLFNPITSYTFNDEFEQNTIQQIARKLASLTCEVSLMYGLFSQGRRSCTKQDFKHTCLYRLGLALDGVQERQLDVFLENTTQLQGSNFIEKEDFLNMFQTSITQIRNYRLSEQIAPAESTIPLPQDRMQQEEASAQSVNINSLLERQVMQILAQAMYIGAEYKITRDPQVLKRAGDGKIKSNFLLEILIREGIHEFDAAKIIQFLEIRSFVNVRKLDELFKKIKGMEFESNPAFQTVCKAIYQNAKVIIQERLERQDYDRDGMLNIDGFQASLRIPEVNLNNQALKEVFYLVCDMEENFHYQAWILNKYPDLRIYFRYNIKPIDSQRTHEETSAVYSEDDFPDPVQELFDTSYSKQKFSSGKVKIENFIVQRGVNLGTIFSLIDTDSTEKISFPEFKIKMRGMMVGLDDEEVDAIFRKIDKDRSGSIDFNEFVDEFRSVNTELVLKKMRNKLVHQRLDPEFFFNKYAQNDTKREKLLHSEFEDMLKEVEPELMGREIRHLTRHFDKGNKGSISKTEFLKIIASEAIQRKTFNLSIEDVIKPIATKARIFEANLNRLFTEYDTSRDNELSAEELRDALEKHAIPMTDEDVAMIRQYFFNRNGKETIDKQGFVKLMSTQFERKCDDQAARKSLYDLRAKAEDLEMDNQLLYDRVQSYNMTVSEHMPRPEKINMVGFKKAVNSLKCLDQYAIDNLTKHVDTENEGFIPVDRFVYLVFQAKPFTSFRTTLTNKWSR